MRPKNKIFSSLLSISALLSFLLATVACKSTEEMNLRVVGDQATDKILRIGHRGAAGLAPENTLAAFDRACEIGVDAFELDVLLSADGEIMVHHDFTLKPEMTRSATGEWLQADERPLIKNLKLAELRTYDVGRLKPYTRYAQRYPDQTPADGARIPTLEQVIGLYKDKCDPLTRIWVEIKTSPEKPDMTAAPEAVAAAVVQTLRETKIAANAFILSFDWRALAYAEKIAPEIPTVYLSHVGVRLNNIKPGQPGPSPWMAGIDVDDFKGSIPRAVKAAGGRYWAPHHKYITSGLMAEAHRLGLQVFVWTPDSKSDIQRLIKMGVDGIITNRPDILQAVISGSP